MSFRCPWQSLQIRGENDPDDHNGEYGKSGNWAFCVHASLGKQLGIIFGGGVTPLIATTLISLTGSFAPIIVYFEAMALLAFVGVVLALENFRRAL
jgi:hypothetical protein